MEIFALVCVIIAIIIALFLAIFTNLKMPRKTSFISEKLENSDIELSGAWKNLKVYNAIFEENDDK